LPDWQVVEISEPWDKWVLSPGERVNQHAPNNAFYHIMW
jgi:hypothetical protein